MTLSWQINDTQEVRAFRALKLASTKKLQDHIATKRHTARPIILIENKETPTNFTPQTRETSNSWPKKMKNGSPAENARKKLSDKQTFAAQNRPNNVDSQKSRIAESPTDQHSDAFDASR